MKRAFFIFFYVKWLIFYIGKKSKNYILFISINMMMDCNKFQLYFFSGYCDTSFLFGFTNCRGKRIFSLFDMATRECQSTWKCFFVSLRFSIKTLSFCTRHISTVKIVLVTSARWIEAWDMVLVYQKVWMSIEGWVIWGWQSRISLFFRVYYIYGCHDSITYSTIFLGWWSSCSFLGKSSKVYCTNVAW